MDTPKRTIESVSPNTDSPPLMKVSKMAPHERTTKIRDIIKEMLEPIESKLLAATNDRDNLRIELKKVLEEVHKLTDENKKLREWNEGQDMHNRSWNLVFKGFTEAPGETPTDCKRRVLQTLKYANIFLQPFSIEKAKRIGVRTRNNNRPIIVRFLHAGERNNILERKSHVFNSCKITVEEDFPSNIVDARRELQPIMTAINRFLGPTTRKYIAHLFEDRLVVNGKYYTTETISKLPAEISTEKIFTPKKNNMVAFFGKHSPLSNYHKCDMTVANNRYNCQEQHYTQQKALAFNDFTTADKIMKETDPAAMKQLGKRIKNFDHKIWDVKKVEVMCIGLAGKFKDPTLRTFLLNTGNSTLMEASPYDKFWGVGLSMFNPRIWMKNNWHGNAANTMGRLLDQTRRDIKHELMEKKIT